MTLICFCKIAFFHLRVRFLHLSLKRSARSSWTRFAHSIMVKLLAIWVEEFFLQYIYSLSEDVHDDHGIQTGVVSRILELFVLSIHILEHILIHHFTVQRYGVKPTSVRPNRCLRMSARVPIATSSLNVEDIQTAWTKNPACYVAQNQWLSSAPVLAH